jgi:phosphatidylinositol-bisphosphatase
MGNKGGVAIRLSLYDSSVCFVCSHLAAHRENVVGRNSDFKNIIQRIQFTSEFSNKEDDEDDNSIHEPLAVRPCRGAALTQKLDLSILDHEIIFWVGDLNYRMDENISKESVFQLIELNDLVSLKKHDQLNIERAEGRVFQGFEEAEISFLPTYKFQPGTNVYEQRPEKKLRAPAFCDRILWKTSNNPNSVRCINYNSSVLQASDHKPVFAIFAADLREVVIESERAVFQELMQRLESSKKDDNPVSADLTGLHIKLCDVKYEVLSNREFTFYSSNFSIRLNQRLH